ncbi:MAG TPA: tetratricopeptide repeat protein [Thermoanaerobaculia bacterium]|jgi:tetratricopeptide (TPR) repeat protein|nr:tetratricopeptide repeat protein [Thermoanaerobaculia bacterium]
MQKFAVALLLLTACATTTPSLPPPTTLPTAPAPILSDETRALFEKNLAEARANYEKSPKDADAIIWLGRRTAYLGHYAQAIEIFTDGARKHPNDARMLRHRGHRWITLRQFDRAIADLTKAADLTRGKADAIEPDGLPNARNIPLTTLQSNIWYHLALAHYLRGDFETALPAWRRCLALSKNPDGVVSASHWLYMTLRRLGRPEEAEVVLERISTDMDIIENGAYHRLLLMYRGEIAPEELGSENAATVDGATTLYGIGNWWLYGGQPEKGKPIFERVTAGPQWSSFGFIAAESDLRRLQ